ncbi:MAG: LytTR family transcriptional regulator [Gemmatimonadaceae bacterium]|jgi:DNA-binding LytR/AlgR family response regulator|nr:LytTR family transcriptional regulator [Gemmatimonadaceae bacterium]
MSVHISRGPLPLTVRRPAPLIVAAGGGVLVLAAYTMVLHALRGRDTPPLLALEWAAASVVAWSIAGAALLAFIEMRAFDRQHSLVRRAAECLVATGMAIVLAAAVRALTASVWPGAPFTHYLDAVTHSAARWSAPGLVVALLGLLATHPGWRQMVQTGADDAPAASPDRAPERGPIAPASTLALRVGTRTLLLRTDTITSLEADGNYVRVTAAGRIHAARGTLHALAADLDPHRFIRVHRSLVISIDALRELRTPRDLGATALLHDGRVVPVSRTGIRLVRERLGAVR